MGRAELLSRLRHDADARVEAIRARTEAEVTALQEQARQAAETSAQSVLDARRAERHARMARELADLRAKLRARELEAGHEVVARVLARVTELASGEGAPIVVDGLPARIEAALRFLGERPATLACSPDAAGTARSAVATRADITVEEVPGMVPGLVLRARDGSVTIDETLEARLQRARASMAARVLAEIAR
jgi:vacuolar-type H+-ATPase subunit E/Vma4